MAGFSGHLQYKEKPPQITASLLQAPKPLSTDSLSFGSQFAGDVISKMTAPFKQPVHTSPPFWLIVSLSLGL